VLCCRRRKKTKAPISSMMSTTPPIVAPIAADAPTERPPLLPLGVVDVANVADVADVTSVAGVTDVIDAARRDVIAGVEVLELVDEKVVNGVWEDVRVSNASF
jgi:hypothetical protein